MNMENRMKSFLMRLVACAAVGFAAFAASAEPVSIRLLFVYDAAAVDYLESQGNNIDNFAENAVVRMNTVLANSRLTNYFTYELAGTTQTQVREANLTTAYNRGWKYLNGAEDDAWDGVLEARAASHADVVVNLVYTGTSGGLTGQSHAYTGTAEEYAVNYAGSAFSCCSIQTAELEVSGQLGQFQVLSHEVAHTLGCGHADTQDNQSGQQSADYSYGYQFKYPGTQNYSLIQNSSYNAWYGCTVMAYKEHFFKNSDGTYMTLAEALDETGWTAADEGVKFWNNIDGGYSGYGKGVFNYCNMLPYFSSPDLYFVTMEGGVPNVMTAAELEQYHYDEGTYVPMGDKTHNNRQVLIDNCGYASRWHLGVKFDKATSGTTVNGIFDTITLSALSDNCTIYYTTDGSEPTSENGIQYTATTPISLSADTTIKARVYDASGNAGDVFSRSYTMGSLGKALGNESLTWLSSVCSWFATDDGAQSGDPLIDGNSSTLWTSVSGEGTISFDYKLMNAVSDSLTVKVDDVVKLTINDWTHSDWTSASISIEGSGEHTIEWQLTMGTWLNGYTKAKVRNVVLSSGLTPAVPQEETIDIGVPAAVWTTGTFEDTIGGYSISLNGNEINSDDNITITGSSSLGATIDIGSVVTACTKASVLIRYKSSGVAPAANAAVFGTMVSNGITDSSGNEDHNCGVCCTSQGGTSLEGFSLAGSSYTTGSAFASPAPQIASSGCLLFSYQSQLGSDATKGTALYSGNSPDNLSSGGNIANLQWAGNAIKTVSIGGATATGGAVPWEGLEITGIALFPNQKLTSDDVAAFSFGADDDDVGDRAFIADSPEEPVEPAYDGPTPTATWVTGEFEDDAADHGGYSIDRNGNTVNDSGNIVIGSATTLGAVIDLSDANCTNASLLVWYSLPSNGAPVANAVPLSMYDTKDMGAVATSAGSSSMTGYYLNGSTVAAASNYSFANPAPTLQTEGYMLLEVWAINVNHSSHGTAFYSGTSIDNLSGGINTTLRFAGANNRVTRAGIGGPTLAGAKPWAGMEIKGVALFANEWVDPEDLALYEFPEAKAVVPSWAAASITPASGETIYYRSVTDALFAIVRGDVDADTVQVLDGSSVDYSSAGFAYDPETQTYTKIKIAIAKIDNGIIMLEFTTLAVACEEADLQNIGVVELLAARDSISEAIPSGWSYVSPEDSGTEYGTILKTISEIPGTVSSIELTQENVSLSIDGEWAVVGASPIYVTLGSATNAFTLSFDADIPDGVYGTLLSWDSVSGTTALDSRVVITNDAAKQVIWRKADGSLSTVGYTTSELIQSGEHYIELNWIHDSGATIKVDGETYYASGSLKFTGYLTSHLAFGGSALGSPDDVLAGLKVKNLNFRVGKQPTEPDEASEKFQRLDYVTRLDGTVYHGNDANRAVITNWQTQITGVAKRPVPEGKADADFSTIDVLFVYDKPGKAYVESNESAWNGASALEVYSAKATAKMNQILCTTDMDTNFWFRMVGVHTVNGTGGTIANILGKCEGLRDEYKYMLELRDRYGADVIVTPTTQSGGYGGLARLNTLDEIKRRGQNAAYHFASVLLNYSQTHAWVHEIGHNMSLNHYPPANFDPANTSRGLGFQHKIAVDGTSMSSVMAEQGYADFCGGFSSINHIYHGSRLSISNHLDSTGVLLEAAPYVSQWRPTRVPETQEIKCSVTYGSYLTGDTVFELSYPDPDAEIHYMVWGENNNEYQTYNGPFTVTADGKNSAYIDAYVITNGAQSATSIVAYNPFNSEVDTLLGSPKLPWTTAKSIDGGWAAASGEEYLEVADSFTGSRTSESTLSTTVVGPDTLSFQHSELLKDNPYRGSWPHTFADSSFTVWVDNEPVYMLRGATNTLESWTTTEIAIPEGTHKVDFTYSHRSGYVSGETVRIKSVALASAVAAESPATVVRVHPRLTRGLAREALLGIRFDNALGGNASAFDVKFRLVNCTKADITDIKYWRQPYTHNYGFYEAEATQGPSATVEAADDATEFTASFPAGSVWFYPQVGTREDSDYLWVTATINPEIPPDAEIWVSVPTAKITLSNGGAFDVVNGAETQPHRVFPFVHQVGAYLRQDGTALTGTWAGKLEDSPANRVGNLTDIVVCNDFLVTYDSANDTFKTTWDARGRDNTAQVARIKALRDQYNPKCMIRGSLTKGEGTITVDGVTGRPIACAAASAARRKQLVNAILAVMESAGLDGLDIDWEYPGDHTASPTSANTQRDWHSYGLLMRDLAAAFFDKGYVLSFCSNLGYQMAPDGYNAAFHAADFVNAMAYGNTTLNASPQVMMTGINVCRNRGVPARRIVVGQAMYAYEVQNPGWGSVVGWLKDEWPDDKTRWWDADLVWKSRTVTKDDGTVLSTNKETFEGPSSYHAKCNWCRANGYGGVMSWGYYTDVSWDDADLMSLSRHQAKSCWPRTNWSWPTPPQDSDGAYLLDSEADWFWLRDNPSVAARFAADIALVHDPLPIETFSGTIDGAGHTLTISNDVWLAYDSNPALVRTLTGTVKNLKIDLYGRVVSRASRWNDTTANKTANTLASGTHNAAVLAANLGAGGVIDGVELFIRSGAEVQGPQRVAGLAASVWVANGSHAEIRNSSVHVDGVVRSLARNTAEGDITVANQCAGGLAGWVGCPGSRNIVVTNNIVSLASTGRVAVETGSSSSAGGVIGDLNNVNPLVQGNAVYVASGATVSANEGAGAGNVRTSYANASYSIASSVNAGQTTFFIEDGAAALADSIGGKSDATVEVSSYGVAADGIVVETVPGFWYSVIYGDELVPGGIGGATGETAPVKAAASGPLTLDAPKDGAKRFYRVKVAPVAE